MLYRLGQTHHNFKLLSFFRGGSRISRVVEGNPPLLFSALQGENSRPLSPVLLNPSLGSQRRKIFRASAFKLLNHSLQMNIAFTIKT